MAVMSMYLAVWDRTVYSVLTGEIHSHPQKTKEAYMGFKMLKCGS